MFRILLDIEDIQPSYGLIIRDRWWEGYGIWVVGFGLLIMGMVWMCMRKKRNVVRKSFLEEVDELLSDLEIKVTQYSDQEFSVKFVDIVKGYLIKELGLDKTCVTKEELIIELRKKGKFIFNEEIELLDGKLMDLELVKFAKMDLDTERKLGIIKEIRNLLEDIYYRKRKLINEEERGVK